MYAAPPPEEPVPMPPPVMRFHIGRQKSHFASSPPPPPDKLTVTPSNQARSKRLLSQEHKLLKELYMESKKNGGSINVTSARIMTLLKLCDTALAFEKGQKPKRFTVSRSMATFSKKEEALDLSCPELAALSSMFDEKDETVHYGRSPSGLLLQLHMLNKDEQYRRAFIKFSGITPDSPMPRDRIGDALKGLGLPKPLPADLDALLGADSSSIDFARFSELARSMELEQRRQAKRDKRKKASSNFFKAGKGFDQVMFAMTGNAATAAQLKTSLSRWNFSIFDFHKTMSAISGNSSSAAIAGATKLSSGVSSADSVGGKVLLPLAIGLFCMRGLFDLVPPMIFTSFISAIEQRYKAVPYHNAFHGADVMQSTHVMLLSDFGKGLKKWEVTAALLAAACHDVAHPGITNGFMIATGHDLAIRYNDNSPLENMHTSTAFGLMQDASMNVLMNFDVATQKSCRKYMVAMILGTDNKFHGPHSKALQTDEALAGKDAFLLLPLIMHGCDVSNPAKPWPVCKQWTSMIMDEFYSQGDKEKELGLKPFCDRDVLNLPKFQLGFINFLVLPYFKLLAEVNGLDLTEQMKNLDDNIKNWSGQLK